MRTLRLIGMTLLMVMLAVNFAACSNDDDDKEDAKPSIVGTWKLVSNEGLSATHVAYNSNGTFKYTSTKEADYEEHGKYKIEGTKLYEMFSDEDQWSISEILLLNSTTLTLQEMEDDGVTPYGKPYSFQRVE